jgi:ParB family transcriptional regulator, chromosome partitioning protein
MTAQSAPPGQVLNIPVDDLMPDPSQPRKVFLDEEIARLAASVAARGILQPLRVLYDDERKKYRIIIGESRWQAARLAGLKTAPCLPITGQPTETDILTDQVIENSCRQALRPLELGRALGKLKALKKCTAQQLATEIGISSSAICKSESLLSLPEDVQALVDSGKLPETAAYEISRLPTPESQRLLANDVAAGRVNRDDAAKSVQAAIGKKNVKPKGGRLSCKLKSGVSITVSAGQPLTKADLQAVIERLRSEMKKIEDGGGELPGLAQAS